jgi:hypothetical protein
MNFLEPTLARGREHFVFLSLPTVCKCTVQYTHLEVVICKSRQFYTICRRILARIGITLPRTQGIYLPSQQYGLFSIHLANLHSFAEWAKCGKQGVHEQAEAPLILLFLQIKKVKFGKVILRYRALF